jgi:restriction system protein
MGILALILMAAVYSYWTKFHDQIIHAALIVLAIVCLLLVRKPLRSLWQRWRRKRHGIKVTYSTAEPAIDVNTMTGIEFEHYVAKLLEERGYTDIKLTERYDLGVDIIACKGGIIWGVQVKRSSGLVKAIAVRQVVTALKHYGCDRAMVVTNGTYSRPAINLAKSNNCVLVSNVGS